MPEEAIDTRETWVGMGAALADVVDAALTPLAVLTTDLCYVAVNRAYCAIAGRGAEDMIGRVIFDVFPEHEPVPEGAPGLRQSLELALSTGCPHSVPLLRYDVAVTDGGPMVERYWHVSNIPIPAADGTPWLVVNNPEEVTDFIDERVRLEAVGSPDVDLTTSATRLQAVDSAFTAVISRLQHLNELASALVGTASAEAIGRALLSDGLALAGATGGSFVTLDADGTTAMEYTGSEAASGEQWTSFRVTPGADPVSDSLTDGMPRFFDSRRLLLDRYPTAVREISAPAPEARAVLPLRVDGQVLGAVSLVYADEHPFDTPLKLVLYTLANLVTQAASRTRLLEEQSTAMRSVEAAFGPSLDPIAGIEVSALYRPASMSTHAGGDWYDIINVNDRCSLIAIGDVANHGPVAVGEMARTRATVHALALQGLAPDEIATQVDRVLARVSATFTTSVIAIFDVTTNVLSWTTAGHPHPLVRSAAGRACFLAPTHGAPLGAGMQDGYGSSTLQLAPGDTLVLYTDGLVERADVPIDDGLARLRVAVEQTAPSADMAADLFERLVGDEHHADDVAVLVLHLT